MESYLSKVAEQEALAKQIEDLRKSYKKEPKRRLKQIDHLGSWMDKLENLWSEFNEAHNELQLENEILSDTEYFKNNVFGNIKLEYDDMKANLRYFLGNANLEAFDNMFDANNEEQMEAEHEANSEEEEKEEEDVLNESFKTVKNVFIKAPISLPDHVRNSKELTDVVQMTSRRFENKLKMFERELNIIENYTMNNLKMRAKLALKDIEKLRHDLAEGMEELNFMSGDGANVHQKLYDDFIMKYREISEEVSFGAREDTEMSSLKLKPISIPTFSGTFKTWPTFSGLFKTMVIDNRSLNNIQKMQYLKTLVTGEAEKSIANIEITSANFEKAWTILNTRYENERAIRDAHLELLLKLPNMSFVSSNTLREYFDRSKECIELLKETSRDQVLLYLLMKKLPNETRKIYEQSRENPTDDQSLAEYFEFLHFKIGLYVGESPLENVSHYSQ